MNRKLLAFGILVLTTSLLVFPGKKEELWQKAITEKQVELRYQYLKDYETEFGDKKDKFNKYLYLNLADAAYKLQKWDETISYGEKAMEFADIEGNNRLNLYLWIANAYKMTKTDMEKAIQFSGMVINLCNEMMAQQAASEQNQENKDKFANNLKTFYMAPSLRLHAKILYDKDKDNPQILKEALNKAIDAYKCDESKPSFDLVFSLAYQLFNKGSMKEAHDALVVILDEKKPDLKVATILANIAYKQNNKSKAVEYYEIAYRIKPDLKTAMKIGQMIHKTNTEKGIKYFAEAYVLSKYDKESDAYKYLQQLHFNKNGGNEEGFQAIIKAASDRLGSTPPAEETPTETPSTESTPE